MRFFKLVRVASLADCTLGVLLDDDVPFCVTLERPWKDNQRNISCIPADGYICKRVDSPKFGDTFEVQKVPGRSLIRIHSVNIPKDTHGCIGLAEMFESMFGEIAIKNPIPGKAMNEFRERTKGINFFSLKIVEVF